MDLLVVPIHKRPELRKECCKLINLEWTRSETARLRSLDCSCDYLPVNLILLKGNEVIGHAKLSKIPGMNDACFVETVVIKNNMRGKGYGTYLMDNIEIYCTNQIHLKIIYLSTKGQEKFYQKLGYTECEPIQLYGAPMVQTAQFNSFTPIDKGPTPPPIPKNTFPTNSQKTYMCKRLGECI